MATFLVEHYLPGSTTAERAADVDHVRGAHAALAAHGAIHVSSMIVDTDEMCMHVFNADTEAAVAAAHTSVGLPCDRIVEVDMHFPAASTPAGRGLSRSHLP